MDLALGGTGFLLGSTDAVGWVPHRSLSWPDAGCGNRHHYLHVGAASDFFFFGGFVLTGLQFALTWL